MKICLHPNRNRENEPEPFKRHHPDFEQLFPFYWAIGRRSHILSHRDNILTTFHCLCALWSIISALRATNKYRTCHFKYCGQAHSGKTAFSEPETMAIRRTLNKYKNAINVYLSFHSAGNWMLYPWGYDKYK